MRVCTVELLHQSEHERVPHSEVYWYPIPPGKVRGPAPHPPFFGSTRTSRGATASTRLLPRPADRVDQPAQLHPNPRPRRHVPPSHPRRHLLRPVRRPRPHLRVVPPIALPTCRPRPTGDRPTSRRRRAAEGCGSGRWRPGPRRGAGGRREDGQRGR